MAVHDLRARLALVTGGTNGVGKEIARRICERGFDRDAAKILGREKDLGTVESGKLADLIIVDSNPLDDMRNIGKLNAVMKGGKLYRKENASPSR